jgi:hypothetical protein
MRSFTMRVCYVEKCPVTDQQQTRKNNANWRHVNIPTRAFLLFIAVAACAAIHLRAIGGDFLSDDFAHASWVADAQSKGELLNWLVSRLYLPLGSGNFAYRPVVFASYALDWVVYGTNAAGWHLTNLVIHLANGALIFVLAQRLTTRAGISDARFTVVSVAALFLAIPFAGESTFWPVGRFDLLACMFSLGFLHLLLGAHPRLSLRRTIGTLVCLLLALLSKESAMPMLAVGFALVLALNLADQYSKNQTIGVTLTATIKDSLSFYWPVIALALAYFAWRNFLFGSPWKVFPDSHFPASVGEFIERVAVLKQVFIYPYEQHAVLWWGLIATGIAFWLVGLRSAAKRASFLAIILVITLFGCFLVYLLAPATSFPVASDNGEGIRNLYFPWAMFSLATGFAIAYHRLRVTFLCALLVIAFWGQWRLVTLWQDGAAEMLRVTKAVPALASEIDDARYALLLLPDYLTVVPFVRNAQGAVVMPPRQPVSYLTKMAAMSPLQFAEWESHFSDNTIGQVRGPGVVFDRASFHGVYCWLPLSGRFQLLAAKPHINDAKTWEMETMKEATQKNCLL